MDRNHLIKECAEAVVERIGKDLEALILLGSFARGEEIVRKGADGKEVFVSDVEFLAVVKPSKFPLKMETPHIEGVDITIGQTTKSHLKKLNPTIFAVELRNFGKVVGGKMNVLDYIPAYTEKEIEPLDAFILLNNRIVEQLNLRLVLEAGESVDGYFFDKGYIQLVNSILAFKRKYQSLYPEKLKAFKTLNDPQFVYLSAQVTNAFENCRKGQVDKRQAVKGLKEWTRLKDAMKTVWQWEAKILLGKPKLTLKNAIADFPRIVQRGDSIKGWGKLIKQKKLSLLGFGALTNIITTSPQFLIYQEAVDLYFADSFDKGKIQKVVRKWEKVVK